MTFDQYQLLLSLYGEQVLETKFNIYTKGGDTSVHNDIELDNNVVAAVNVEATINKLYSENGMLYMELCYADGQSETIVFEKADEEELLDGYHAYADNEAILSAITGTWTSADGRYVMRLTEYYEITITLDEETVLIGSFDFAYLLPREPDEDDDIELNVSVHELVHSDGTVFARINNLYYDANETADKMILEIHDMNSNNETVELCKVGSSDI